MRLLRQYGELYQTLAEYILGCARLGLKFAEKYLENMSIEEIPGKFRGKKVENLTEGQGQAEVVDVLVALSCDIRCIATWRMNIVPAALFRCDCNG